MADWVTLGAMVAIIGTTLGVLIPMFTGLRKEISGLRQEMRAEFGSVDAKFAALDSKIERKYELLDKKFDTKLDGINKKFDTKLDGINAELISINRRLPAERELAIYSSRWRERQSA